MSNTLRISLKAARVNAGMTQDQVCKSVSCSKATLVKWENGETSPTVEKAIELARLYKMPLEAIDFALKVNLN